MSRKAIIFHGSGANPDVCWYQWLGRQSAERGYQFGEQTVLVGHSGGAVLLLAVQALLKTR